MASRAAPNATPPHWAPLIAEALLEALVMRGPG